MTVLAVVIVAVQAATGALWWATLRRTARVSALELVGMGLALGTFASMLTGILLVATPLAGVGWLLPTAVVLPIAVWLAVTGRFRGFAVTAPRSQVLAGAVGIAAGIVLVAANWSRVPLNAPTTESFADLYFFEALARGLAEFGPAQSILMSGGSLRYHWFAYAWAGDLAANAGTAPFVAITRILPLVTLVGVTALVAAWAGRLSRVRWVPTLAVLVVVVAGYAGALYGAVLNFDSPSQAMTTLWLLALAVAFTWFVRARTGWPTLVPVTALAAACTGGKISHAIVAAGGIALVVVVGLVARQPWARRALVAAVCVALAMAITYVLVLSGVAINRNLTETVAVKASTWQGLDPIAGRLGVLLGTAALTLAVLTRLGGLGWVLAKRRSRLLPDVLFATGGVMVGLAAMLALREGINELWFVLAASAPAGVVSAAGVGAALKSVRRHHQDDPLRRPLIWSGVVAVPATVVCLVLSRNWTSHQSLLNWLAPLSLWILVPVAAAIVVRRARRGNHFFVADVVAISIAGLALTSVATRPSVVWTASRPVTTETGTITPVGTLSQEVGSPAKPGTMQPETPSAQEQYAWDTEAAAWVQQNTPADAILATSDPASAKVPALTGRTMYLAGEAYQAGLGKADELDGVEQRAAASRAFGLAPTQQTAAPLCAAGIDLVWLEGAGAPKGTGTPIGTDGGIGTVVFSNEGVRLVSLGARDCG